jgi:hypothetical protein
VRYSVGRVPQSMKAGRPFSPKSVAAMLLIEQEREGPEDKPAPTVGDRRLRVSRGGTPWVCDAEG